MDITKRIIDIREQKRIKQIEIAEKLSIDRQNYSRLEKRGDKLTIEQLKEIAGALGVELNELLGIEVNTVQEIEYSKKEIAYLKKEIEWRNELLNSRKDSVRLAEMEKHGLKTLVDNAFIKVAFDKALELGIIKNGTNEENFRFLERLSKNDLERLYREQLCKIPFMYHTIRTNAVDSTKYFTEFHNDFFESNFNDYWLTPFDLGK